MQSNAGKRDREEIGPVFPTVHLHRLFNTVNAMRNAVEAHRRLPTHLPHVHQHIGYASDVIGMKMRQNYVLQLPVIEAKTSYLV